MGFISRRLFIERNKNTFFHRAAAGWVKRNCNGPLGYVEVSDTLNITDHDRVVFEFGLNKFYPCDIEKQNERHEAAEGPTFQPSIPRLEYRVITDSEGLGYSNGINLKTSKK